jgi:CRISPR/Cas system CSM-associated protein Csm3 (group 7 of RAMP superfamily)
MANDHIHRRIYAEGIWTLESVAHFGGEDGNEADMTLLRDSQGDVYIPGTSIAGAARAYLARCLNKAQDFRKGNESDALQKLFGGSYNKGDKGMMSASFPAQTTSDQAPQTSDQGMMSALFVEDGLLCNEKGLLTQNAKLSIRDGVRLDGVTGVAADKAKYDAEVIEPQTRFLLRFSLVLRDEEESKKNEMLRTFARMLKAFETGQIALGAKTRRGYGHGKISAEKGWEIQDLSMSDAKHILAWLSKPLSGSRKEKVSTQQQEALSLADWMKRQQIALNASEEKRRYFEMSAQFKLKDALLIRSYSERPNTADVTHLHAGGSPIISGTSWAGVLRHQAEKILNTLFQKESNEAIQGVLTSIFGSIHEGEKHRGRSTTPLAASRLWVKETTITKGALHKQTRVAIDRFTGGAADTALFEEEPLRGENDQKAGVSLQIHLEEPQDGEIGLLLLVLKDLWYGFASVGGTASLGRGVLEGFDGKLTLQIPPKTHEWRLQKKGKGFTPKDPEGKPKLNGYIEALSTLFAPSTQEVA